MFATGDMTHWLICTKEEPQTASGANCMKRIIAHHNSEQPSEATWMCRQTQAEDPCISYENQSAKNYACTFLYAENSYASRNYNALRVKHNGLNVWIRSDLEPPISMVKRAVRN